MSEGLRIKDLSMTCEACPSQWEGRTEDGRFIYIRYRWGHLSVDLDDYIGETVYAEQLGDEYDGLMTTDEMLGHTGMVMS